MDQEELKPQKFDPKTEDICISVYRGTDYPDCVNFTKLYVYLMDTSGSQYLEVFSKTQELDSDMLNPKFNLDLRITKKEVKERKTLVMYFIYVTMEELNSQTSSPLAENASCIFGVSLLPLFVEDENGEPADKNTKVIIS